MMITALPAWQLLFSIAAIGNVYVARSRVLRAVRWQPIDEIVAKFEQSHRDLHDEPSLARVTLGQQYWGLPQLVAALGRSSCLARLRFHDNRRIGHDIDAPYGNC